MNFGEQLTQATINSLNVEKEALFGIMESVMKEAAEKGRFEATYIPVTTSKKDLLNDPGFLEEAREKFLGVSIEKGVVKKGAFLTNEVDCLVFKWGELLEGLESEDIEKE